MSAETPRNSGTEEPILPQRHEGNFSGFLRRFLGMPLEPQLTQQPPSRTVQVTTELSVFANRINEAKNDGSDMARKAQLEQTEQERQRVEKRAREKEAMEQQSHQLIEGRLRVLGELKQIAEDLKIRDRLEYINATVWEGKGQIRNVSAPPESAVNSVDWNPLVGFELSYSYSSAVKERKYSSNYWGSGYDWRFIPGMEQTSLFVAVQSYDGYGARSGLLGHHVAEREEKVLVVRSPYAEEDEEAYMRRHPKYSIYYAKDHPKRWKEDYVVRIGLDQLDKEDIEVKLDQILVHESTVRVSEGVIPSKLILAGQEKLREAKASPQWTKWEYFELYSRGN